MKTSALTLLVSLLFCSLIPAFALEWAPTFEEAKSRAAAENKLVLAVFYGSEFTRRHNPLREGIMGTEGFRTYAEDKFVPVEMYEPRDRAAHADFIWKYRALSQEYGIEIWPTTLVLTPEGIPTGGLMGSHTYETLVKARAYREYSAEERLNLMFTALDDALHLAGKLREVEAMSPGEDRCRVLEATYYRFPQNLRPRLVLARHLAELDPENKTGLQDEYLNIREMVEWGQIGRYGMDRATALRKMQEMIEKARPDNRLTMLEQRFNYRSHDLNSAQDVQAYTEAMEAYAAELERTDAARAAKLRLEHEELYGDTPEEGFRRLQERRERERREKEEERREKTRVKSRWPFFRW